MQSCQSGFYDVLKFCSVVKVQLFSDVVKVDRVSGPQFNLAMS